MTFAYIPARDNDFDVVLIDTAGRMQDNEVCHQLLSIIETALILTSIAAHASSSQGNLTARRAAA